MDAQLFVALAQVTEQRVGDFKTMELANAAWAFVTPGIQRTKVMQKLGAAASLLIEQFDPENLLKFLSAYEVAGGKDESWTQAVASQHVRTYKFPSLSLDVALSTQVPGLLMKAQDGIHMTADRSVRTGMVLWEAAFVLAEFLSRHSDLAKLAEVKELMGENGTWWNGWKGKSGVELGAGLGLPSIVASNMGAKMIATDGDDKVLHLLGMNMEHNAPLCRVEKMLWGSAEPLTTLGLTQEPDFVLAANVLYDPLL